MGSVSKYFSSLENRTGTKFFLEIFFFGCPDQKSGFRARKVAMMGSVSKRVSRPNNTRGEKKILPPKFLGQKVPWKACQTFFFGNHLPSADGKSLVKSDSNNSKLNWLQRDHKPYWRWNSTQTDGTWWCIWTRIGGTWWYRSTVRRRRGNLWAELETLRELDAKISNLTRRCNRKFNKATTEKKTGQRLGLSWDVMI